MEITYLKWVPVVDSMSCTGCNTCIEVCGSCSLALVDNVSTLISANTCGSEDHCIPVCPEACITMRWVKTDGDHAVGIWRTSADPDYIPNQNSHAH